MLIDINGIIKIFQKNLITKIPDKAYFLKKFQIYLMSEESKKHFTLMPQDTI